MFAFLLISPSQYICHYNVFPHGVNQTFVLSFESDPATLLNLEVAKLTSKYRVHVKWLPYVVFLITQS